MNEPILVHVIFFKGRGWLSGLIRWFTRSRYNHVAIEAGGHVYEALLKVEKRDNIVLAKGERADIFEVEIPDGSKFDRGVAFLETQVGRGYDWRMFLAFFTRKKPDAKSRRKWFCSELVFQALDEMGARPLERVEAWRVSPDALSMSPRLKYLVRLTKRSLLKNITETIAKMEDLLAHEYNPDKI